VTGRLEAIVEPPTQELAAGDRDRLEKELATTEQRLAAARDRLANPAFTERAPSEIVDGVRTTEAELAAQAAALRERLRS
jgi:valyl-tRNA synthetase